MSYEHILIDGEDGVGIVQFARQLPVHGVELVATIEGHVRGAKAEEAFPEFIARRGRALSR